MDTKQRNKYESVSFNT